MRKVYRGKDVEVSFDLDLCVHIGECLRGDRRVFVLDRRPWVLPDGADADVVAQVVERCPSGALRYRRLDGGPGETRPGPARMTPIRDGPLMVVGTIEVRRQDGTVEALPRVTLCRCGESANKPFCDNSHLRVGFRAPGSAYRIHLSEVRLAPDRPLGKDADPRRMA